MAAGLVPPLHDGYEVHRAALRGGLDVLLLPRQVLTARRRDQPGELAFVHGIPDTSTLAAVTYAQDKRMRRELLARAGLPVPEGATFAIGREGVRARAFAERIGYPVVVKPAVGDNLSEVFAGLRGEPELAVAIDRLRVPEAERPGFVRAAYGLTLLLEPEEEDGRAVSPAGYQFLVERHVSGEYLRLLVLGDQVVSAVHCPDGPAHPGADVTGELHPSIRALAVEAAGVVPGLAVAAVDVVLADHRRAASDQQLWIVEFSERPWLAVQAAGSESLSHELGEAILTRHAAERGVDLDTPREDVAVDFHLEGITDPDGAVAALSAAVPAHDLSGQVRVSDRVEGTAEGSLQGPAGRVAWLFELLLDGQLDGQRAMLVEARHDGIGDR